MLWGLAVTSKAGGRSRPGGFPLAFSLSSSQYGSNTSSLFFSFSVNCQNFGQAPMVACMCPPIPGSSRPRMWHSSQALLTQPPLAPGAGHQWGGCQGTPLGLKNQTQAGQEAWGSDQTLGEMDKLAPPASLGPGPEK